MHFEKGSGDYKGLLQFVSQAFASLLPEKYIYINREQDLGIEGLRQTKLSLRPSGFVKSTGSRGDPLTSTVCLRQCRSQRMDVRLGLLVGEKYKDER